MRHSRQYIHLAGVLAWCMAAAIAFAQLPPQPANGPATDQPVFHAGDRVEVNPAQMAPPNTKWYPATVTQVYITPSGEIAGYKVRIDTVDGSNYDFDNVPRRANWIRLPAGNAAQGGLQDAQGGYQPPVNGLPSPPPPPGGYQPPVNGLPAPPPPNGDRPEATLHAGDRVEVNLTQMMAPNTKWVPATVVKVNTTPLGDVISYRIRLDGVEGTAAEHDDIPKRPNWIRASQ